MIQYRCNKRVVRTRQLITDYRAGLVGKIKQGQYPFLTKVNFDRVRTGNFIFSPNSLHARNLLENLDLFRLCPRYVMHPPPPPPG